MVNLQVSDAKEATIEIRMLVSARNAPQAWDLRCVVREAMITWLQTAHPEALPRHRTEWVGSEEPALRRAEERRFAA